MHVQDPCISKVYSECGASRSAQLSRCLPNRALMRRPLLRNLEGPAGPASPSAAGQTWACRAGRPAWAAPPGLASPSAAGQSEACAATPPALALARPPEQGLAAQAAQRGGRLQVARRRRRGRQRAQRLPRLRVVARAARHQVLKRRQAVLACGRRCSNAWQVVAHPARHQVLESRQGALACGSQR